MNYTISYQQRALRDYEVTVHWYKERSEPAAENFEAAVKEIKHNIGLLRHNIKGLTSSFMK